jgi:uncharacterized membrane protein YcaP (DUF421 family)
VDIGQLFRPEHTLELVIRGTVVYLAIYTMLRILARRELGTTGATNILLLVLLADAAQNAMAGQYTSVTDGIVLVGTIVGWAVLLDLVAYVWPWFARLVKPPSLALVEGGRPVRRHLRRELMTDEELRTQLREHGVQRIADVKLALMESDGRISVIPKDTPDEPDDNRPGRR